MTAYVFHPEASLDLEEIWEFIATDSVSAADRVISEILERIATAVELPHQGHRRPDLTSRPLRFLRVFDYLVAYADEEKPLWVIAVMHGRRNPRIMAAMLRERI